MTMKKEGHELVFLGGKPIRWQELGSFGEALHIPMGNSLSLALTSGVRKKWLKVVDNIKPDVIHAHNVISASFFLETEYPVIYDDHEYWSKQIFKYDERSLLKRALIKPLVKKILQWEKNLLEAYPTITTHENIAREHREICRHVVVARNVPNKKQIAGLTFPEQREGAVYVGNDFALKRFLPHRNMTGLVDILNFSIICGLTHREMLESITKFRVGLTPWHPHEWHRYSDANRNYEYLHAGLPVVVNETIKDTFIDDPYVHAFANYSDIPKLVSQLCHSAPEGIARHARDKYLWERQENVILDTYKIA
ncbi:MAG: hypothetical protein ACFE7R_06110 [Candidatus Hodarchaeota archaeon]